MATDSGKLFSTRFTVFSGICGLFESKDKNVKHLRSMNGSGFLFKFVGQNGLMPVNYDGVMRVRPKERDYIVLLCPLNRAYSKIVDYYVMPPIGNSIRLLKQFGNNDEWLIKGTRLEDLRELYGVAKKCMLSKK